jgi:hypothetical protein
LRSHLLVALLAATVMLCDPPGAKHCVCEFSSMPPQQKDKAFVVCINGDTQSRIIYDISTDETHAQ